MHLFLMSLWRARAKLDATVGDHYLLWGLGVVSSALIQCRSPIFIQQLRHLFLCFFLGHICVHALHKIINGDSHEFRFLFQNLVLLFHYLIGWKLLDVSEVHSGNTQSFLQLLYLFCFLFNNLLQSLYYLVVVLDLVDNKFPIYLLLLVLFSNKLNILLGNSHNSFLKERLYFVPFSHRNRFS